MIDCLTDYLSVCYLCIAHCVELSQVTILRHYMVKISKERYELTTRYIFTVLGADGYVGISEHNTILPCT